MAHTPIALHRAPAGPWASSSRQPQQQISTSKAALSLDKVAMRGAMVLLTSASLLAAQPASAYDVKLGAEVFTGNCAACHTGGKNVVEPAKTLERPALEQYLAGGFNVEAIKYQVENGKGGMPAWKDRLDDEEIEAVANYVYEQAANNSW